MAERRLYFDSDCEFCTRWMHRAVGWGARRGVRIEPVPLSSPEAAAKGYGEHVVLEAGRTFAGSDAWIELLALAPWYLRPLALAGRFRAGRAIAARIYRRVAAERSCARHPR